MKRKQEVCASAALQPRSQLSAWRSILLGVLLVLLVLGGAAAVSAQVNTASLSGTVFDPQNLRWSKVCFGGTTVADGK